MLEVISVVLNCWFILLVKGYDVVKCGGDDFLWQGSRVMEVIGSRLMGVGRGGVMEENNHELLADKHARAEKEN